MEPIKECVVDFLKDCLYEKAKDELYEKIFDNPKPKLPPKGLIPFLTIKEEDETEEEKQLEEHERRTRMRDMKFLHSLINLVENYVLEDEDEL